MALENLNPTSLGPVAAKYNSPESAGPLFPKTSDLDYDLELEEAGKMLAELAGASGVFQIHPSLRSNEGPIATAEKLFDRFDKAISRAHTNAARDDSQASLDAAGDALDIIHHLVMRPDLERHAPLHSFLPRELAMDTVARLTFSYTDLVLASSSKNAGLPEINNAIHYLDLMQESLPNPLEGESTTARERLLRMLGHVYTGRALNRSGTIQEAIKQYEQALEINDLHQNGIEEARLMAHVELIGLHLKRAHKLHAEKKTLRFLSHIDKIIGLREHIENNLPIDTNGYKDALIGLRADLARNFWHLGLVDRAYRELCGIGSAYNSSAGRRLLEEFISGSAVSEKQRQKNLARFVDENGNLKDPDELEKPPKASSAWLWASHTLKNAQRSNTWNTVKAWAGGSLASAGAIYAVSGGDASMSDLLTAAGAGAAAMDGALRLISGAGSPQAKEATALGLDDISLSNAFRHAAGFAANTLLPYAIMGGRLPGLGILDDAPILGRLIEPVAGSDFASGSIYGPGAIPAGAFNVIAGEAQAIAGSIINGAAGTALGSYADHVASTTLGSTISAAYSTYLDAAHSIADGSIVERVGNAVSSRLIGGVPSTALAAYEASSAGYYLASRLSPKFRTRFNNLGPLFVPGGIALAADLGDFLGANPGYMDVGPLSLPMNLMGIAAVGAGYQVLGQTLNGNRKLSEIQWFNVIAAAQVINLYVGASSNFDPLVQSQTFGQMIAESVGRQIGLLPIIATHGAMLMVNPKRFAQNKAARLLGYDHFGNVLRIALGPWDGFVPVLAGVTTGFLITNSLLGRTFNDLAGSKPAALSFASMLKNAGGQADESVLRALARSLRRLPVAAPLTKMNLETLTLPARAFVDSLNGKKLARYMLPEQNNYRMIHDALMEEGRFDESQLATLLSATEQYLRRPGDEDIARGLSYLLVTARHGPHSEQIGEFLNQNRSIYARLRVDRNAVPLPGDPRSKEEVLWNALRYPYRAFPQAPQVGSMPMIGVPNSVASFDFARAASLGLITQVPLAAACLPQMMGMVV
ncbi:MAG: hypothetical protein ABH871_10100 [Pseudomonadota bacterium]